MKHRIVIACVAVVVSLGAVRAASAQEPVAVGGGIGYTFDEHKDFLVVQGIGWIPIERFPRFYFTPLVVMPRFQYFQGIERWQIDLNGIWDVPVAETMTVRPFLGIGVGLTHMPGTTTPLFNFEAGFRIKKPGWSHQFATGLSYSAGLDYLNSAVLHFSVLFPIGRR
jgi:hypothetical protein